jgi:hypothetical protein
MVGSFYEEINPLSKLSNLDDLPLGREILTKL